MNSLNHCLAGGRVAARNRRLLLTALLVTASAHAADPLTLQWTGLGTTDHFGNTANWLGLGPDPTFRQLAIFSGGSARSHINIDRAYELEGMLFANGPSGESTAYVLDSTESQLYIGAVGIQNHSSSTVTINSPISSNDPSNVGDVLLAAVNGNLDINVSGDLNLFSHVRRLIIEGNPNSRVKVGMPNFPPFWFDDLDSDVTLSSVTHVEIRTGRFISTGGFIDGTDVLMHTGILDLDQSAYSILSLAGEGEVWIGRGTLTIDDIYGDHTYHGALKGVAGGRLIKHGKSELTLMGDNSGYLGSFRVDHGTLRAAKGDNISNQSTVTIGSGARLAIEADAEALGGLAGAGKVELHADLDIGLDDRDHVFDGSIVGTGDLTKAGRGRFDLNGVATFVGGVRVAAGMLGLGTGHVLAHHHVVTVDKDATLAITVDDEEIGELAGSGRVELANTALSVGHDDGSAVFGGSVRGQGDITKAGAGVWQIIGSSDAWQGRLRVAAGSVLLRRGDTLSDGVTLQVDAGATAQVLEDDERIGGLSGAGELVLERRLDVGIDGADREFSGASRGAGGLSKSGGGRLLLSGDNSYAGETVVSAGTLRVTGKLGGANARIDGPTARVEIAGSDAKWHVERNLLLGGGNGGLLSVEDGGRVEVDDTLDVSARGHLALLGGTLDVLRLRNNRGGEFDMMGGRLQVGTFQGTLTNLGGTLAPGHSPGVTTITGDYEQAANATLEIELAALDDFDQLSIKGAARLGGRLAIHLLDDYVPEVGDQFVFLSADQGITGDFNLLDLPSMKGKRFSLLRGDATHLSLLVTAVPVPASGVLFGTALCGFGWLGRKRQS